MQKIAFRTAAVLAFIFETQCCRRRNGGHAQSGSGRVPAVFPPAGHAGRAVIAKFNRKPTAGGAFDQALGVQLLSRHNAWGQLP